MCVCFGKSVGRKGREGEGEGEGEGEEKGEREERERERERVGGGLTSFHSITP